MMHCLHIPSVSSATSLAIFEGAIIPKARPIALSVLTHARDGEADANAGPDADACAISGSDNLVIKKQSNAQ